MQCKQGLRLGLWRWAAPGGLAPCALASRRAHPKQGAPVQHARQAATLCCYSASATGQAPRRRCRQACSQPAALSPAALGPIRTHRLRGENLATRVRDPHARNPATDRPPPAARRPSVALRRPPPALPPAPGPTRIKPMAAGRIVLALALGLLVATAAARPHRVCSSVQAWGLLVTRLGAAAAASAIPLCPPAVHVQRGPTRALQALAGEPDTLPAQEAAPGPAAEAAPAPAPGPATELLQVDSGGSLEAAGCLPGCYRGSFLCATGPCMFDNPECC